VSVTLLPARLVGVTRPAAVTLLPSFTAPLLRPLSLSVSAGVIVGGGVGVGLGVGLGVGVGVGVGLAPGTALVLQDGAMIVFTQDGFPMRHPPPTRGITAR
jgi:hypothetical protein